MPMYFLLFCLLGNLYDGVSYQNISPIHKQGLFMAKKHKQQSLKPKEIVVIEDIYSDMWKLESIAQVLQNGGVGVVCTDTCYSFVTQLTSREGINRIAELKRMKNQKKPLSILCKDLAMIAKYTSNICEQKWVYKLLKATLPGPYTYIIPASKEIPKLIVEHNNHVKRFKRKEIGVRIPDDPVCSALLDRMDVPLLSGSVPEAGEDLAGLIFKNLMAAEGDNPENDVDEDLYETFDSASLTTGVDYMDDVASVPWVGRVDFIVINGPRGLNGPESLSTVVDLTAGDPVVIREGKGRFDFTSIQI